MTISEYLQQRRKPFVIADRCASVTGVIGIGVFTYFLISRGNILFALEQGWWALLPGLLGLAFALWLGNTITCPRCSGLVRRYPIKREQPAIPIKCTKCGTDFSLPMPGIR